MTSLDLKFACGFVGKLTGVTGSPGLTTSVGDVVRCIAEGANQQVYVGTLTIAASGTQTLDLTTGLTNPLNEAISGSNKFLKVKGVFIEHDAASVASGITAFGGASNEFQGVWAGGDKATLAAGRWIGFGMPATDTGVDVDATHKNIAIVNSDGAQVATVNVFIHGTIV